MSDEDVIEVKRSDLEDLVEEKVRERLDEGKNGLKQDCVERNVSRRSFLKKLGVGTMSVAALGLSGVSALDFKTSKPFNVYTGSPEDLSMGLNVDSSQNVSVPNGDLKLEENNLSGVNRLTVDEVSAGSLSASPVLKIPSLSSDPSNPEDRQIWINSNTDEVKVHVGDRTLVVGTGVPQSGVSFYDFEQNLSEDWNSRTGSEVGSVAYSTDSKRSEYSLDLNGSDAYVDLGSDIGLSSNGPFSIAGWVKMNETPDRATMFSGFGSGSNGSSFDLELSCWVPGSSGTDNAFGVHTWSGGVVSDSNVLPAAGEWGHYVVTYSGGSLNASNITLYLNGSKLDATRVDSNSNNLSNEQFELGYSSKNSSNISLQQMQIDSLKTFNKALTSSEVSNLFNNGTI